MRIRWLGLTICKKMYIFKTTKHIKVLGFALNFVDMTAKINPIKVKLVLEKIENSLDYKKPITRQLVAIIGLRVSLFPVLPLGKLHCWKLKKQKTNRLKLNQENFNSKPDTFNTLKVQELHYHFYWNYFCFFVSFAYWIPKSYCFEKNNRTW